MLAVVQFFGVEVVRRGSVWSDRVGTAPDQMVLWIDVEEWLHAKWREEINLILEVSTS